MATIRYWAAAKAAAGVAEERYDAATLADLVAQARAAHADPALDRVLDRCAFVVDDAPIGGRSHAAVALGPDSVAEALPPFAGGAGTIGG
jgi:molybdopterin synthase sulfur carrier subunit